MCLTILRFALLSCPNARPLSHCRRAPPLPIRGVATRYWLHKHRNYRNSLWQRPAVSNASLLTIPHAGGRACSDEQPKRTQNASSSCNRGRSILRLLRCGRRRKWWNGATRLRHVHRKLLSNHQLIRAASAYPIRGLAHVLLYLRRYRPECRPLTQLRREATVAKARSYVPTTMAIPILRSRDTS